MTVFQWIVVIATIVSCTVAGCTIGDEDTPRWLKRTFRLVALGMIVAFFIVQHSLSNRQISSEYLQAMADSHLYQFDNMPSVQVAILSDKKFEEDRRDRNLAAYYETSHICVRQSIAQSSDDSQLDGILRHELVHAWMDWKHLDRHDSHDHGPLFRQKDREVGGL
jgi:hypothetical protein